MKTYPKDVVPGHYTIQVSSWKTARQAQKILQEMTAKGYDSYIQRVWFDDRNEVWWRVRVGDFASVTDARKLRDEIAACYPEAWVDNVRKESTADQQ